MSYFVHTDCNHFYVSCERLFNPSLEGLPVIVLSKDGCSVAALSQEAKKLGIKTGDAYFKIKAFCTRLNVVIFTSNHKLYGDVSHRVMDLLSSVAEEIEVNSIDEAFLKYSSDKTVDSIISTCNEIRDKIKKWVGIPLTMGIGPTKTLAKIANDIAKKERTAGIIDLTSLTSQKKHLECYAVRDLREMEPRLKEQLKAMEIRTAWEFRQMDPSLIRRRMGAAGEQMLEELRGISCKPSEGQESPKSISYSRSFDKAMTDSKELGEALSAFVSGASVNLREQKWCAKGIFVFFEAVLDENKGSTSHFSITSSFPLPTNDREEMAAAAKKCLDKLYSPSEQYTKCGIMLLDLMPEAPMPSPLFLSSPQPKRKKMLESVDALNTFYRKNTLYYGTMGIDRSWKMQADQASPHHAEWKGLAFALAK